MKVAGCGLRFPGAQPSSKKRNLLLSLRADFYPPRGGLFGAYRQAVPCLKGSGSGWRKVCRRTSQCKVPLQPSGLFHLYQDISGHIGTYRDKSGHQAFGMYYLCIVNTGWDKLVTITHRHRHHLRSDLVQGRVEKKRHI